MPNNPRRLWIFGGSNSKTNYMVDAKDSYWGLAAKHLKVTHCVNISWGRNSLSSILHLIVNLENEFDIPRDFLLIGIPPLERITVFDQFANTKYHAQKVSAQTWSIDKFDLPAHLGLTCMSMADIPGLAAYEDRTWTEIQALRDIFFLTSWLRSLQVKFAVINQSKNFDASVDWPPKKKLTTWALQQPNISLFNNSYVDVNIGVHKPVDYNLYQWHGHHGAEGNHRFFELGVKPLIDIAKGIV